jgi:hypothetical protein
MNPIFQDELWYAPICRSLLYKRLVARLQVPAKFFRNADARDGTEQALCSILRHN